MVRTALDALPLPEKTGLPYASTAKQTLRGVETPVMHACGHDIHMAVWVAVAKTMLDLKDQWSGTLMFVAQPAEEGGGGAKSMVTDGLFTRFPKPDYGFALHVGPGPFGAVSYKPGVINSTSDGFSITFIGKGGHGSRPHTTIDPIMMAGHFIVDVQSVISREKDAARFGVVTIGWCRRAMPATSFPTARRRAAPSAPTTTPRDSKCSRVSSAPPRRWR